jgi:hypothetical protein
MKYYLHDSNAFNDEKITQLYIKFGYEGLGLFYTALEKFSAQEKPINTEVLKKQLNIGKRLNKCWLFMEQIGIICSSDGESFNKELLKFSEKYQIKKEKNSKRIAEWRSRHENVTCYERVSNTPKDKISKVNRSKVNRVWEQPTVEIVKEYCLERKNSIEAEKFVSYYQSNGWKVGRNPMKDWKACVRTWELTNLRQGDKNGKANTQSGFRTSSQRDRGEELDKLGKEV